LGHFDEARVGYLGEHAFNRDMKPGSRHCSHLAGEARVQDGDDHRRLLLIQERQRRLIEGTENPSERPTDIAHVIGPLADGYSRRSQHGSYHGQNDKHQGAIARGHATAQNRQMTEVTITEARRSLSALVDQAREAPVFLTPRNRTVAVIVGADQLEHLRADADELADMRTVGLAWQEANELREAPIL